MLVHFQESDQSQNSDQFGGVGSDFGGSRGSGDLDNFAGILVATCDDDGFEPGDVENHCQCRNDIQPEIVPQKVSLSQKRERDYLQSEYAHQDNREYGE